MNFKNWLISEGLVVKTSPGLEPFYAQAQNALTVYLNRYKGPELKTTAARYEYTLSKVDDEWWEYTKLTFSYLPIEKSRSTELIAPPDDWRYGYEQSLGKQWDGKTGRRQYKTPKDAIEEIPADPSLGYRGISWEEWQSIRKTGVIKSLGNYNLQGQDGLTFWGYSPETAIVYSSSFTPVSFKATPTRPGVIIAVPRTSLITSKDHPGIPQSEMANQGSLSASDIVASWMVVATTSRPGTLDLLVNKNDPNKVQEGSRSDISIGYAIQKMS